MINSQLGEPQDVFPFFVGAGRSGTTLLRAMFDSHPELAIPNEAAFIVRLARERGRYETSEGFDVEAFSNDFLQLLSLKQWDLSRQEVRDALASDVSSYPDAIRRLFHFYALREGKPRYGNKTPAHVMQLPLLSDLFPEAKFVHIIRDGRSVALSHLDIEGWGPRNLGEAAAQWKRQVRSGLRDGSALGSDRYREVRYEQLLDRPEETLAEVCEFIGLRFDGAMLHYFERAEQIAGDTPHFRNIYRPPTKGLRDWRRQMNAADLAEFESIAGDLLTQLGYELGGEAAPPRLRSWSWRMRVTKHLVGTKLALLWRRIRKKGRFHSLDAPAPREP